MTVSELQNILCKMIENGYGEYHCCCEGFCVGISEEEDIEIDHETKKICL